MQTTKNHDPVRSRDRFIANSKSKMQLFMYTLKIILWIALTDRDLLRTG